MHIAAQHGTVQHNHILGIDVCLLAFMQLFQNVLAALNTRHACVHMLINSIIATHLDVLSCICSCSVYGDSLYAAYNAPGVRLWVHWGDDPVQPPAGFDMDAFTTQPQLDDPAFEQRVKGEPFLAGGWLGLLVGVRADVY